MNRFARADTGRDRSDSRDQSMLPAGLRHGLMVCSLLVPLWVQAAPSPDSSAGKISVAYSRKSNVIHVEASDAALRELVEEMANQAGFRLLGHTPPDIMVSIRKMNRLDLLLFELLDRGSLSFIFLYDNLKTGRLSEVVILGGDGPEGTSKILSAIIADRVPDSGESDPDDPGDESAPEVVRASPDPVNSVGNLLKMAESKDPMTRSAALATLVLYREEDEAAAARIREALFDPDQLVRSTAVGLLGSFLADLPETGGALLLALSDASPEVRQQALLTLWEWQSPMVPNALLLAVRDENPQIRMWANDISRNLAEDSDSPEPTP